MGAIKTTEELESLKILPETQAHGSTMLEIHPDLQERMSHSSNPSPNLSKNGHLLPDALTAPLNLLMNIHVITTARAHTPLTIQPEDLVLGNTTKEMNPN